MRTAEGRAPAKLILAGEHAVVYGHPAVAVAVDRSTRVRLAARPGPTGLAGGTPDPRLRRALAAALPAEGLEVRVTGDVPVGRGMGSSASLAVALVRARAAWEGREATPAECIAGGFAVERVFHGNPSGIDHTVVTLGGALAFRRGGEPRPVPAPPEPMVVLDSGTAGDTARLVAAVAARRPGVDPVLDRIGDLAAEVIAALEAGRPVGALLTENHRLLRELGVSTPELDALVELALAAGASGAKLAGAGGGGVVVALAPDPEPVLRAAARAGVPAFAVRAVPPATR